jgi:hypothetical protein
VNEPPPDLFGTTWMHSHEEDSANEMVFRPSTFAFPPSRGRTGFKLSPDGRARTIGIAAGDGPDPSEGVWAMNGPGQIQLKLSNASAPSTLNISSVSRDKLVLQKT